MDNEAKILQMLEMMQSNITGIQSDIGAMRSDMISAQSDIISVKDGQKNLELRLENEAFAPIRILSENVIELTNRQASTDESIKFLASTINTVANKIDGHTERLERIEDKIESHDIQIEVLDRTKSNKRKVK